MSETRPDAYRLGAMRGLNPRRWWQRLSEIQRDLVLGLAGAVAAVAALLIEVSQWDEFMPAAPLALAVAFVLISGGSLSLARRMPLLGGILSSAAYIASAVIEYEVFVVDLISAFVVGVCAANASRRSTLVLGVAVVGGAIGLSIYESINFFEGELVASVFVGSIALAAVPVAIGDAFRVRRELTAEAEARAARVEQLRELELERAVDEERLRIARDVHDTVGHHLSAIAIQAGAGEQLAEDGDAAAALGALATIRGLTGNALAETRRLLGLVRTEAERRAPGLAGAAEIEALARRAEAGGLEVVVRRVGEERPLDGVIGDCAYRIVQEALTNVTRHAAAAHASVELRYGPDRLELVIDDDGVGGSAASEGHGLIGMRERVAMVDGALVAGPGPTAGWQVRASLPYEPSTVR